VARGRIPYTALNCKLTSILVSVSGICTHTNTHAHACTHTHTHTHTHRMAASGVPHARGPQLPISLLIEARQSMKAVLRQLYPKPLRAHANVATGPPDSISLPLPPSSPTADPHIIAASTSPPSSSPPLPPRSTSADIDLTPSAYIDLTPSAPLPLLCIPPLALASAALHELLRPRHSAHSTHTTTGSGQLNDRQRQQAHDHPRTQQQTRQEGHQNQEPLRGLDSTADSGNNRSTHTRSDSGSMRGDSQRNGRDDSNVRMFIDAYDHAAAVLRDLRRSLGSARIAGREATIVCVCVYVCRVFHNGVHALCF